MASAQLTFDKEMSIFHPGVFNHRSLFEIHGSFDESFGTAGDYGVLLQELKSGNALFIRDVLDAATMVGGLSSTPGFTLLLRKDEARERRMKGFCPYRLGWWRGYVKAQNDRLMGLVVGKYSALSVRNFYRKAVDQKDPTSRGVS